MKDKTREVRRNFNKEYKDYERHLKNGDAVSKPKKGKKKATKTLYAARQMDDGYDF